MQNAATGRLGDCGSPQLGAWDGRERQKARRAYRRETAAVAKGRDAQLRTTWRVEKDSKGFGDALAAAAETAGVATSAAAAAAAVAAAAAERWQTARYI